VTHITQRHIQKRVDNKYRKEEAEALMEHVLQLKLGEIVTAEYQAGKQKRERKTKTREENPCQEKNRRSR
jgi:predicted nucleic acid-binding protein